MGLSEFVAGQLRNPSGFFGRFVMSRFFNRSSAAINQLTLASLALEPTDRVIEVGFGAGDLISRMAPVVSKGSIAGGGHRLRQREHGWRSRHPAAG